MILKRLAKYKDVEYFAVQVFSESKNLWNLYDTEEYSLQLENISGDQLTFL